MNDAHSCQYCDYIFVDLPESRDGFNFKYILGFRLELETVKTAVLSDCSFLRWALGVDLRLLEVDTGDSYLDDHIADLPGFFTGGVLDQLTEYEEFEGDPKSGYSTPGQQGDLEQTNVLYAKKKPYLKLYLQCFSILWPRRCWVSKTMARSDKTAKEEFAIFGKLPHLELVATDGSMLKAYTMTEPIVRMPSSPSSLALSKSWLEECLHCHHHEHTNDNMAPARLLQVSTDDNGVIEARIVDVTEHQVPAYLTLSYCWGGDQRHKTTIESLSGSRAQIDIPSMPATIQDAIKVTLALGYHHIWIDSLCVIQDLEQDKITEIEKMPSIYSRSVCTISASFPADASEGFLQDRSQYTDQVMRLGVRARKDGVIREPEQAFAYPRGENHFDVVEALATRGWALQERLLSLRILEYRRKQAYFMCPLTDEYENNRRDGWTIDWAQTFSVRVISNEYNVGPASLLGRNIDNSECFRNLWIAVIEIYTARQLTFAADRALAISGIARQIAAMDKTGSSAVYVAGNWLSLFPFILTWTSNFWSAMSETANVRRIPSWSWTSVNIPVSFAHDLLQHNSLAQLVSHELKLRDQSAPFGDVVGATLTISACVFTKRCRITDRNTWHGTRLLFNATWKNLGVVFLDSPIDSQGRKYMLTLVVLMEHNSSNSCEVSGIVVAEEPSRNERRTFVRLGSWKASQVLHDSAKRAKMMRSFTKFEFETFDLV